MEKSKAITGMCDRRTDVNVSGTGIVVLRKTKSPKRGDKNLTLIPPNKIHEDYDP